MSDIPTQAFHEILRRLPMEALPRFRRVCKSWKRTIDDYLRLQPRNSRLILRNRNGKLHSIPLSTFRFTDSQNPVETEVTIVKRIIRTGIPALPTLPVSSCHGLILLWSFQLEKDWAIWNPFTKDFYELPCFDDLMSEPRGRMARGGIGYDRVSDDYKVVRVSQIHGYGLETLIYSLKSDEWTRIADYSNFLLREDISFGVDFGVFANGAIHWIMCLMPAYMSVVMALDLGSESYRQLPMPLREDEKRHVDTNLECLNECLVLSYSYTGKFDVWMMKDYDGESSWVKFFSFKKAYDVGMYIENPKLVAYFESTKDVLIQNGGKWLWYDMENKQGRIVEVAGTLDISSFQAIPVCRVRLPENDDVDESAASQGTLKRKRKSSKQRLRLKLTSTVVCFAPEPK